MVGAVAFTCIEIARENKPYATRPQTPGVPSEAKSTVAGLVGTVRARALGAGLRLGPSWGLSWELGWGLRLQIQA
jgi:hypothetical protein